eukprot:483760-Alexandrium_andersonii.AAC.1
MRCAPLNTASMLFTLQPRGAALPCSTRTSETTHQALQLDWDPDVCIPGQHHSWVGSAARSLDPLVKVT